ncbi:hypothetical protein V2J09_000972 [Rumex salicifolius]
MSDINGDGKVVCVTGAAGYIASWLVKELLARGYTIKASVRNLNDPKKTEHLLQLEGAKDRLHLFEADLLEEGSFDSAINGSDGVFHVASPCFVATANPQTDLLDPAIKGTLNVLASCVKSPSVKRVILTSSFAAVLVNDNPLNPSVVVDETWFSDPEKCRKRNAWYPLSKTLAEQAALKFAKENNMDLISMVPGMVVGPLLQPTLNHSSNHILKLTNGTETYENFTHGWVHVKDVAEAHIRAFERADANGRYCLVDTAAHFSELVEMLKELYPTAKVPHKCADDEPFMTTFQVSKERVKCSLGMDFIPLKTGLKDTVESLKEKKFITIN